MATAVANETADRQPSETPAFSANREGGDPSSPVQIDAVDQSRPDEPPLGQGAVDPVEAALADALTRAAQAGQWATVETLSRELQARREARAAVVDLGSERKRRGR